MNQFKTKYPSFTLLLALIGNAGKELGDNNESFIKNLADELKLFPQVIQFMPVAHLVDDEAKQIIKDPAEILQAAEILVTEFGFSNEKAKEAIDASFELAEGLVSMAPKVKRVIAAIKA